MRFCKWNRLRPSHNYIQRRFYHLKKIHLLCIGCISVTSWVSTYIETVSLYNINWLFFVTKQSVYCAVRTEYLRRVKCYFGPLWLKQSFEASVGSHALSYFDFEKCCLLDICLLFRDLSLQLLNPLVSPPATTVSYMDRRRNYQFSDDGDRHSPRNFHLLVILPPDAATGPKISYLIT